MSEMTATRIGRLATVVVLSGAWLVAAWLLWQTSVPSGLDVSGLRVQRFFTPHALDRAARYQRFVNALWLVHVAADVLVLSIFAWRAPRLARRIRLGRMGTGVVIAILLLVTLWVVSIPFGFVAQWWEARHGLAPHDYLVWIAQPWAQLAVEATFALVAVMVVLALAGRLGDRWLLIGAPIFLVLGVSFVFADGYVSEFGTRIPAPTLRSDARMLERREGVSRTPVHVQKVSGVTTQANAFTNGFGSSTNVLVWDTLLDGRFTRGEIR